MSAMLAQLRALKEAHAEGLIDDEEFAIAKKDAMTSGAAPATAAAPVAAAPAPVQRKSPRLVAASPAVKEEAGDDSDDDKTEKTVKKAAAKAEKSKKEKKKKGPKDGKKPLQEFEVGKSYPGTVVSLTQFGAYIDVGCHSDGLCHVSRLSDDYVASVEDVVKKDQLVIARVVEIDFLKKQLTLSLQSEKMMVQEKASADAKRKRDSEAPKDKDKPKAPKVKVQRDPDEPPKKKNKRGSEAQARRNAKRLAKKGITV
jgi:transcriptional accessory protein Tex/SPT6